MTYILINIKLFKCSVIEEEEYPQLDSNLGPSV